MRKKYYYSLENMEGKIRLFCATKKLAKKLFSDSGNEGVCYKRMVGDTRYKKFAFMW